MRKRLVFLGFAWVCSAVLAITPPVAHGESCSYSGRAYGAFVNVLGFGPMYFADTGSLPATGGTLSSVLLTVNVPGIITADHLVTNTSGMNCQANSDATVQNLIVLQGNAAQVTATTVQSTSHADCSAATGGSTILALTFGGIPVVVTGGANQTVTIPGVATLIINEEVHGSGPDITVNALHLLLVGGTQEVIVSSSHSDIVCLTPNRPGTWGRVKALYR